MDEHKHESHSSDVSEDQPVEHHEHSHEQHAAPSHTQRPVHEVHRAPKAAHNIKKAPVHHEHVAHATAKKRNYLPYIIGIGLLAIVIALIIKFTSGPSVPTTIDNPAQYGKVDVAFYVMSQCPYGTQVEDGIAPVLNEFGENVNFKLNFIAAEQDGTFQSLHGPAEVTGDKIHLCVQKYYPKELINFVVCQNKNVQNLEGTIDGCAKETGIDAEKVKTCYKGTEGTSLLSDSVKASQAVNAQGSPTMFINNQPYNGARDKNSFKRAICVGLNKHPLCGDIPACSSDADCTGQPGKIGTCQNPDKKDAECAYKDDVSISMTVLNAKDCASCDSTQLVSVLKQVFLKMDVKEVEASSTEGKALIKKFGLEKAPAYVFSAGVDKTYAWSSNPRIQGAFKKSGENFVLLDEASGATYILDAAKRQEMEEKTGVKKGDNKPQIDFYVMSYCPYGNMAEEAVEPVYQLLKDNADFNPHYVIYSNYGGGGPSYCLDAGNKYCSMHGIQELNQDIRELCVNKYMGIDSYFKFVLAMNSKCTASNADKCWEQVAKDLKLDTAKIKTCQQNEGESLVAAELELNKLLGVQGSPTVFIEGQPFSGGRDAASFAQALCAGFETAPAECSASSLSTLGGAPTAAPAAGGCG
jgi:predicted DsbA family dithiol-disulfide isomerase